MKNIILKNGIRLVYYKMENVHSAVLSLCFKVCGTKEALCGIAHMTEHMLFRRANSLCQEELYRMSEELGSEVRGTTYKDMMRFSMKIRPMYFRQSLHILSQLLYDFEWTQEEFEAERQVVLRELDEKFFDISDISDKIIFKGSPAAMPVLGTCESLMNMSVSDVNEFRRGLCSAGNITAVITGSACDSDFEFAARELEKIPVPKQTEVRKHTKAVIYSRKPDVAFENTGWDIAEIRVCFDVPGEVGEQELLLLNSILGGGTGARLQMALREKRGLTYDIFSQAVSHFGEEKIYINYSVNHKKIYESLQIIKGILSDLKKDITPDEINRNIVFFTENYCFDLDDSEKMNENISWHMLYKPDEEYSLKCLCEQSQAIVNERLMCCAEQIFVPRHTTVVAAGKTRSITKKEIRRIFEM